MAEIFRRKMHNNIGDNLRKFQGSLMYHLREIEKFISFYKSIPLSLHLTPFSFHFTSPIPLSLHLTPFSFHFTSHTPLSLHYILHPSSIFIHHFFLQIACCSHILFSNSDSIVQPTKRWWLQEIEGFYFEDQHAKRGPKEQHQAQQLTRSKFWVKLWKLF